MTRLAACVALLVAVAACEDVTLVDLEVSSDPAWGLDRYEIRVGDLHAADEPRSTVRVALPDHMAGHEATFEVWGLAAGNQVAYGAVTVVPELGAVTRGHVDLAAVSCGLWCEQGATACERDGT